MADTTGRYETLEPDEITRTAERLSARVHARFPDRGLDHVTADVVKVVRRAADDADEIARPRWKLRIAIGVLIVAMVATFVIGVTLAFGGGRANVAEMSSFDWLGVADSAINDLIFGGIALFFLLSLERRRKRGVALSVLHRLRSLAHVIDMHQLTKDPERLASGVAATEQSPTSDLTPEELGRYLDYCSEMLSLVSKVAAVYAEATNDAQVLATVNEIESLVAGLSRKIWQKITLLHATQSPSNVRGDTSPAPPPSDSMIG